MIINFTVLKFDLTALTDKEQEDNRNKTRLKENKDKVKKKGDQRCKTIINNNNKSTAANKRLNAIIKYQKDQ